MEVRGGVGVFGFNYRRFNCYCLFIFFLSRFLGCLGGMGFIVYGGWDFYFLILVEFVVGYWGYISSLCRSVLMLSFVLCFDSIFLLWIIL